MIEIGEVRGKSVFYDFSEAENSSILITGTSGMGKTTMLNSLIKQEKQNSRIVIFDALGNFSELSDMFKINKISLGITGIDAGCSFSRNVDVSNKKCVADIAKKLSEIYGHAFKMGLAQKNSLYSAIKEVIKTYKKMDVYAVCDKLLEMETTNAMNVYAKLEYAVDSGLLESELDICETVENNEIILFDLQDLDSDMQSLMVELILSIIVADVRLKNIGPLKIVLDEAQNYRCDKDAVLSKLLVEGRNYGVGVWLATQYLTERFSKAVINRFYQAALHIYFKPVSDERVRIVKDLSSDREEQKKWGKVVEKLDVGECIVKGRLIKDGEKKGFSGALKIRHNLNHK